VIGQLLLLKILQNTSLKLMDTFSVRPNRNGTATRDIITDDSFDVNFAGGTLILETEPIENLSAPLKLPKPILLQVAHINLRTMY
jgi:hypothetical protein